VSNKVIVREKFRRLRLEHPEADKRRADQLLSVRVQSLISDLQAATVMSYRPLKTEADPFLGQVPAHYFYPQVTGDNLKACSADSSQEISASHLDVVLVPGIAFDRQGNRLGFGKGYYDRFLKSTRAARVGIAYSFQVSSEELPVEDWDERVEWIVTDRYVLHVEGKGSKSWKL
jgi:5-formyltetrahydrofolate cyclo-ligase